MRRICIGGLSLISSLLLVAMGRIGLCVYRPYWRVSASKRWYPSGAVAIKKMLVSSLSSIMVLTLYRKRIFEYQSMTFDQLVWGQIRPNG